MKYRDTDFQLAFQITDSDGAPQTLAELSPFIDIKIYKVKRDGGKNQYLTVFCILYSTISLKDGE